MEPISHYSNASKLVAKHDMDKLITLYQQQLNLKDATFSRIDHADALVAIVYKVVQPNGIQHILKICPRLQDYSCEIHFLKYFTSKLPVPNIIQTIEPRPNLYGAIFMQCLPGSLLKTADLTDSLAYEMGVLLGRIHLNRTENYGDITQPHSLNPDPSSYFNLKFTEGITECSHHLPKGLLENCRRFYDRHIDLLALVDGPCITHRDFRPGNVIVNEGKLQGIIDWASARASFAEEDFCPLERGEWSTRSTCKKSFLEGYSSIRPVPDYSTIMPLLCLSRIMATIGFTLKTGTWKTKNARLYQSNRRLLDEFFAFSTYAQ